MLRILVVLVALCACNKKKPAGEAAGSGSGSAVAGSGSGSAAAPADAAVAAPAELVPKKLGEKEGVVFAEKQGGEVGGIKDGTKVDVVSVKEMGVGGQDEGGATVKVNGKEVALKADQLILEGDMERSADGKFFVWKPIVACGDMCHTVVWFVGMDGKRVKLGDGGPDVNVSYDPKGGTAAVGSGSLYMITLADFTVKHFENYTSPAYGPDGTLYVRDEGGSAFTLVGDKGKRVWKAPKRSAEDEEMMGAEDPMPVTFKNGKPEFGLEHFDPDTMQPK